MTTSIREEDILKALRERPKGQMTYVVTNGLNMDRAPGSEKVTTDQVRRQLEKMERAGKVKKAPSIYARQICWAPVEEGAHEAAGV